MRKRRILVILPSFDAGGAENYALRLIRHAGTGAFDWHVTSGNLANRSMEPVFAEAGAVVHHASPGFAHPGRIMAFLGFLRRHSFDAVMSLNGEFGGVALSLARLAGVPVRLGWHRRATPAYPPTPLRRAYARLSRSLLDWGSTMILSNSQAALDRFHGPSWVESSKFQVIPNGVDQTRFQPRPDLVSQLRKDLGIPADAFVIGHVGRFDPAKDHETLFAIARALRTRREDLRLLLVGTGTDGPVVLERLVAHGIADITQALGIRQDVHLLYSVMDVFVFPSVTEGQPNALIEAMLSGVPIVATDIPGIREAVPQSLHARLVPTGDVAGFTDQVERLAVTPRVEGGDCRAWAADRFDLKRNLASALRPLETGNRRIARA